MKKLNGKRILPLFLAGTVLVSSCTSSTQAAGGLAGASLGSNIGEAIGWLAGSGYHGRSKGAALGSLIGMGVGAVLGVGIASSIEEKEKAADHVYDDSYGYDNDYGYQTGGGASNSQHHRHHEKNGSYEIDKSNISSLITLSDLTYMDENGDGYLSKNETIEVEGYVTNSSNSTLNDIVIFMSTNDEKLYSISPSLSTSLQPGQRIKYTGRLYCKKAREEAVKVTLNTMYEGKTESSELYIKIKK